MRSRREAGPKKADAVDPLDKVRLKAERALAAAEAPRLFDLADKISRPLSKGV